MCQEKHVRPKLKIRSNLVPMGEVAEQIVDTANEDGDDDDANDQSSSYLAHINSFSLTDFYELCQYMAEEVDLQHIDYVWIDAICVDQRDKVHRKSTIRHMSEIYERASFILAVPDMHLAYLKTSSANHTVMELVRKHALYIYNVIAKNDKVCDDIERIWCYNLLCDRSLTPSQYLLFYRHQLKSKLASLEEKKRLPPEGLACLHLLQPILDSSSSISSHVQRHVEKYWFLNQTINKSLMADIQDMDKKCIQTPHRPWRLYTSSDHPDYSHRPRQLDLAWLNHPWHGTLATTIIPNWNKEYYTTTKELRQAFDFLEYLVDEWSNRAWVISEYLIAKQKQANRQVPMKFIFLLLRPTFPSVYRRSTFFHVFEPPSSIQAEQQQQQTQASHPWRSMGIQFRQKLTSRLAHRDFIDMIVDSKATRAEDRFHSILPLWQKYKHVIVDDDTIASWGVTDDISVRLRLYLVMQDVADKLRLLHACAQFSTRGSRGRHDLLFPTFATLLRPSYLKIYEFENDSNGGDLKFNNITAIDLIPGDPYRLRIACKRYYKRIESENDSFFQPYYRSFGKKIHAAPLGYKKGRLVAIIIPLFDGGEKSRLHFIGDESSNRWILVRYIQFYHWRDLFTGPHDASASFDIY